MNRVFALEKTLCETQQLVAKYREEKKKENEMIGVTQTPETEPREEALAEPKDINLSSPK